MVGRIEYNPFIDVVLRLNGDCEDHLCPIDKYMRVIGSKTVNQTNLAWNTLLESLRQYKTFFPQLIPEAKHNRQSNYQSFLES